MQTKLLDILQERNIENVLIAGVQTHISIYSTIVHAQDFNIKITIIEDCVESKNEKYHDLGIAKIRYESTKVLKINLLEQLI
jgi:nicotinamidase-related amidase